MNALEAKFKRESKSKPTHWVIVPKGFGRFELAYIGGGHE